MRGFGDLFGLRVGAQLPLASGEVQCALVAVGQPRRAVAARGAGQTLRGAVRLEVQQAPAQLAAGRTQQPIEHVVHAQADENHARRRRRQVLVDDHADLIARLLRQPEAATGGGLAAALGTADGRRRRSHGQRVHAQRGGVALLRLDIAHGHDRVVRQLPIGLAVTVEHPVVALPFGAHRRFEARQLRARHPLRVADGVQVQRFVLQPPRGGAAQVVARRLRLQLEHAMRRLQRLQRTVEPGGQRLRGGCGLTLEGAAQPLLVPARDRHRRGHQQRSHRQQRQRHRRAPWQPGAARPADQRQRGRCRDQHAQRIADPPGPPGECHGRGRQHAGQVKRGGGDRRVGQAGQRRGQQQEAPDIARLRQGQRLRHEAPHQSAADPGLQGGAQPDQRRRAQRRDIELPARRAQADIDGKPAQRGPGQRRASVDPGGGESDAGRRVQRRRVARRESDARGQPAGQRISQQRQGQHPRPTRFGVFGHRGRQPVVAAAPKASKASTGCCRLPRRNDRSAHRCFGAGAGGQRGREMARRPAELLKWLRR